MAESPTHAVPHPTPIYRMVHMDCLDTLLARDALHAPTTAPNDGRIYRGIHAAQTQMDRGRRSVPCGPGGAIQDYVGFYFGPRSPMLYRIHTGWNVDRVEQSLILYLVTTAQTISAAGLPFVFTDRHTLANVAKFRSDLDELHIVDFRVAYADRWKATPELPDRQEKKQAEFLVHRQMPWQLIRRIGVLNKASARQVQAILANHPGRHHPEVGLASQWYY
jgi:hypothetical protein